MRRRRLLPQLLLVAMLAIAASALAVPAGALAAGSCAVDVSSVDTHKFPYVRVAFTRDCDLTGLPSFQVTENGKQVSNISMYNGKPGSYEANPKPVIMLVLDASKTMSGFKFAQAQDAAKELVAQMRAGDRVGLVVFGAEAKLEVQPTEDAETLNTAIETAQITQGTRMHDALAIAADSFPSDASRQMVVLLADGQDLGSELDLGTAVEQSQDAGVEIYAVGIDDGGLFIPQNLRRVADATGGTFQSVTRPQDLELVYGNLGRELLRGYWMEYRSSAEGGTDVKIEIEAKGLDDTAVYSYGAPSLAAASGAQIKLSAPKESEPARPAIQLPSGQLGMILAATPFGLLLAFLLWSYLQKRSRPDFSARIERYTKRETVQLRTEKTKGGGGRRAALQPLFRLTESFLGTSALFKRFHFLLEQANLPLREVELLWMMVGGAVGGAACGFVFMRDLLWMAVFVVVGGYLPYKWIKRKAKKRKKKFEEQLADVLTTIAASLKAGHSFNQSIAAVIKEAPAPTSEELQRVMTESRLGLPLEEALDTMARRMDSADFEFAVTTVNIQRTVGGSLSEILEMVGDTVRNRQQFRKKVKALTSMGSMSAYVLLGMPIFMIGILTLMNRTYMEPLLFTGTGHAMLGAGAFFMTLGYFSCMKIVKIKC